LIYVLLLLLVTVVWGWTFVVVKDAVSQYPTVPFLAIRFGLALLVLAPWIRRLPSRRELGVGAVVGALLAAGYFFQTLGLNYTSPGNSGLITGLFVVFTPLLERFTGRPVGARTLAAVLVALAGTVLLAGGGAGGIGVGDLLTLACAIAFALHIVLLSRWSPGLQPASLALVQMAFVALVFGAASGGRFPAPPPYVWFAVVVTGVLASALAFYLQTWAQAHLSASRTAVIFAGEPAWALFFSVWLYGQRLNLVQAVGAALVLAAILGHELAPLKSRVHHDSG